uniref:non-specific serine/threonine protein kinase n=1 Tax=Globodera rostochiensis TaxID=31243 RepID=A0A914IBJ5_GLORO
MFPDEPHSQFTMISQIGSGSFGKCFLCKRVPDGAHVVLKKVTINDESKNEARLHSQISHENVVCTFESYLSHRSIYIVLEHMAGGNLHEHIKRHEEKPIDDMEILNLTAHMTAALTHIHQLRIIHRDIKPRNVLLSADMKTAKLCDFGIAIKLPQGQRAKGRFGEAGTINYMAPEILEGREYDFKCDIWSLGCIVYELVVRKKAFPGCQELAVFHKICSGIITYPLDSPSKLIGLIKKLLTASEDARPSAPEVIALIEQC